MKLSFTVSKIPFLVVALIMLLQPAAAQTTEKTIRPAGSDSRLNGYRLVWSDEFDGQALNPNEWDYRTGVRFWSLQQAENVSVTNGKLRIALKKEKAGESQYTSGGVISKRAFKFGYYEARIKMPRSKGWHTAFWAKRNGEDRNQILDIGENDSINRHAYTTNVLWFDPASQSQGIHTIQTPDLSAQFHVWGCEFTPTAATFYFDGKLVDRRDVSTLPLGAQNLWLTSIAGPQGNTDQVEDSALPAYAEFDYVRFFEAANSIIVFGDSITEGGALPAEQRSSAWIRLVEARSNGHLQMINEGKGGRPTDSVSEFTAMLQRQAAPTALAILLGTNDSRDVSGQCVPKAVANIKAMILAARKSYGDTVPILLIGPPNINKTALGPTRPIADQREANLRDLGIAYETLAHELRCAFVSLYGVIPAESLNKDGVHPDPKGNEAIATRLLPAMLRLIDALKLK
ncbi:MAG TPA: family 16 glycosylhydrolase [Blastocatellia bacterium]|nr:family 16 glycosylhydrolase [Blastocatellia bacterium]